MSNLSSTTFRYSKLAIAATAAAVINGLLFVIGSATGASMKVNTPAYTDVDVVVVVIATLIPLLIAGAVTMLIARKKPGFQTFARWAGFIFAIVSIGSLFAVTTDTATLVWLSLTHVVAGFAWLIAIKKILR